MTPTLRRSQLRSLSVRSFRTYERLDLDLHPGLLVLAGPNGVGKTNLLEAMAIACLGASPRTSAEFRCIQAGSALARVAVDVVVDDHLQQRAVTIEAGSGKRLVVDNSPARSTDSFAETFPAVVFLPERLLVVRGAPARRRATLDRLLIRLRPHASAIVRDYTRAVTQRNVVLRRARSGYDVRAELAPWTQQVAELGNQLRELRAQVTELMHPNFVRRLNELTRLDDGSIDLELRGANLSVALSENESTDMRRGTTSAGPHLDDLRFLVGDRDLRTFGSTGEQRAALLAWALAEADTLAQLTGAMPVLLLDEPYAELDAERRGLLSDALLHFSQAIVTTTEPPRHLLDAAAAGRSVTVLTVSSGAVHPWTNPPPTPT